MMTLSTIFLTAIATTPAADNTVSTTIFYGVITAIISAVVGAIMRSQGKSQGVEEGRSQAMHLTNQPLIVALEEKFVTREDFREFKTDTKAGIVELGGLFRATMTKIDERDRATNLKIDERDKAMTERIEDRDERLTAKIEQVARGAYEGRGRIHQTVNEHSKQIAAIAENADVAKEIGKLAAEIKKRV